MRFSFTSPTHFTALFSKRPTRLVTTLPTFTSHYSTSIPRAQKAPEHHGSQGTTPQPSNEDSISLFQHLSALKKIRANLNQRFQDLEALLNKKAKEEEAALVKLSKKEMDRIHTMHTALSRCLNEQYKYSILQRDQNRKNIKEKNDENKELTRAISDEYRESEKLRRYFCARAALERIVKRAEIEGIIKPSLHPRQGLEKIAKLPEFLTVLHKEVQTHCLNIDDVQACIQTLYDDLSTRLHGGSGMIIVRAEDFPDNEGAALIAFLKFQSNWPYPLTWEEDSSRERS